LGFLGSLLVSCSLVCAIVTISAIVTIVAIVAVFFIISVLTILVAVCEFVSFFEGFTFIVICAFEGMLDSGPVGVSSEFTGFPGKVHEVAIIIAVIITIFVSAIPVLVISIFVSAIPVLVISIVFFGPVGSIRCFVVLSLGPVVVVVISVGVIVISVLFIVVECEDMVIFDSIAVAVDEAISGIPDSCPVSLSSGFTGVVVVLMKIAIALIVIIIAVIFVVLSRLGEGDGAVIFVL